MKLSYVFTHNVHMYVSSVKVHKMEPLKYDTAMHNLTVFQS